MIKKYRKNVTRFSFYWICMVLTVLAVGVLTGGLWFYNAQEHQLREANEKELMAIAQLKVNQIVHWRAEKLADARFIMETPFYAETLGLWMLSPDANIKQKLMTPLLNMEKSHMFSNIYIVDRNGRILLGIPKTHGRLADEALKQLAIALREKRPVFTDLHYPPPEECKNPHIDVIAPLFISTKDSQKEIGAVIFSLHADQYLYPLIQSWPIPSRTAETLLVRREGDHVLFLNELRHKHDTAFTLKIPLSQKELPAAMAILGKEGIVEGKDYRGEDVLAAVMKIPDSPWFMVSKMDKEEAFSLLYLRQKAIIGLIAGLIAFFAILAGLFWQRKQRLLYEMLYNSEAERMALIQHFEYLVKYANDIIILADEKYRIVEVNDRALDAYGYTRDEMIGLSLNDTVAPEDFPMYQKRLDDLSVKGSFFGEAIHKRKDGSRFPVEINARSMKVDEKNYFQGITRDITERKKMEERIKSVNRLYALLSDINQSIVRNKEAEKLFKEICRIAVESGQFRMAWVGLIDNERCCINPMVHHGYEDGYLQTISLDTKDKESYSGRLTTRVIQEGMVVICNDIEKDQTVSPQWKAETMKRGYRSVAAVPLKLKGEVIGNFNIYSDKPGFFSNEEQKLLEEVRVDICYALEAIEIENEHKKMAEALKESERRLKEAQTLGKIGYWEYDVLTKKIEWSDEVFELYMRDKELGTPSIEEEETYYAPGEASRLHEYAEKVIKTGEKISYDFVANLPDGRKACFHTSTIPVKNEDGRVVKLFGTVQDISEQKMLEVERQRVEKLESIGILAGGIAHDFNNILTAILGNINLAKMKTNSGDEIHNRLTEAEKASILATNLTRQLLTFAKGGVPVKKAASISEIVKDTVTFALRGTNIMCTFSIASDLWQAEVDEGQISQVIHNIVINAQQAMPLGGVIEIRAKNVTLSGEETHDRILPLKTGDYIRIAITDHGVGIPEEHLNKIFDPYFTTKQKGTGLGLATSYSIIRAHSGYITADSVIGVGSTFYIYLPASPGINAVKKYKEETVDTNIKKGRILVMDDEVTVREVAGEMLKYIGYEDVEFATGGTDAIKMYKKAMESGKPFTVVILDLTIPGGMGGKETMKNLLEIDPEVRAVVSSGYANEPVISEFKKYGFRGVVQKPYTTDQLAKELNRVIKGGNALEK